MGSGRRPLLELIDPRAGALSELTIRKTRKVILKGGKAAVCLCAPPVVGSGGAWINRRSKTKLLHQGGGHRWDLLVVGGAGYSYADAIEGRLGGQVRVSQLLDQLAHEHAAGAAAVIDQLLRRGGIERQRAHRCIDCAQPRRVGAKVPLKAIAVRPIEDENLHLCFPAVHLREDIIDAHALPFDVGFPPDVRVDGNEEGLPISLNAITAEIEQRDRTTADAADESGNRVLHLLLVDILLEVDRETVAAQLRRQRARIADGRGQRRGGLGIGVADDKRHARAVLLRPSRSRQQCGAKREAEAKQELHAIPPGGGLKPLPRKQGHTNAQRHIITSGGSARGTSLPSSPRLPRFCSDIRDGRDKAWATFTSA